MLARIWLWSYYKYCLIHKYCVFKYRIQKYMLNGLPEKTKDNSRKLVIKGQSSKVNQSFIWNEDEEYYRVYLDLSGNTRRYTWTGGLVYGITLPNPSKSRFEEGLVGGEWKIAKMWKLRENCMIQLIFLRSRRKARKNSIFFIICT